MEFSGNPDNFNVYLTSLSRSPPPPLPGGYVIGEEVYYTGPSKKWDDGDTLTHGQSGEVTRPATLERYIGKGLSVMFPGNKDHIDLFLTSLSRSPPPPLPGGYAVGELVFFIGRGRRNSTEKSTFKRKCNRCKLTRGMVGEVTGPATRKDYVGKGVTAAFPGYAFQFVCLLTDLSREPPPPPP